MWKKIKDTLIYLGLIAITIFLGSWAISYLVRVSNSEIQKVNCPKVEVSCESCNCEMIQYDAMKTIEWLRSQDSTREVVVSIVDYPKSKYIKVELNRDNVSYQYTFKSYEEFFKWAY